MYTIIVYVHHMYIRLTNLYMTDNPSSAYTIIRALDYRQRFLLKSEFVMSPEYSGGSSK